MRIVAGKLRSLTIETIEGNTTRPTADRIKEAIFSSIGPYFYGGRMLDCYAGSGNIGFEAISRGIDEVDAFEIDLKAIKCIQNNVKRFKIEKQYNLHKMDVVENVHLLKQKYDLIYLDPPYALQKNHELIQKISDCDLLNDEGILIVESSKEDQLEERIGNYVCVKEKKYGITKIQFYERDVL